MRKLSGYGPSLIVLVTAMLVLFLGPSAVQQLTYTQTQVRIQQASQRLEGQNILAEINQAYRDIATLVEPSVAHISAQQIRETPSGLQALSLSSGSGWIYDEDGHVVTNHHVVEDAERIEVQLASGELREATIVGFDKSTDIAVLKVPAGRLHAAERADLQEPVRQGDLVFAFGSPFDFRFSMSSGVVSGKGRHVGVIRDQIGRTGYENFIQVDAAINPGNSGGPLTNYRGHVIGMNTAIATGGRRGTLEDGQFAGIGLAIPLEMIEPVVSQIIEQGFVKKGYLGVKVENLSQRVRSDLGFDGDGVWVFWVEPDGPAAASGMLADDVVVKVNGDPVSSRPQLQSIISSMRPGQQTTLSVWREGEIIDLKVELARLDALRARGEIPADQSRNHLAQLGIARMATTSRRATSNLGVPFRKGVLLEELVPESELALRVEPGSIIIEVNGEPVKSVDEFLGQLRRYDLRPTYDPRGFPNGGGVRVGIIRPDDTYVTVRLRVQS
jgi:serine protease Do